MHFEGNILDHRWLSAPKLRYENGKLNINAALVLADIIYWHRPTLVRHESSGRIIEIRKKFSGPDFWKDYASWADGLGLTKRQVQDAVSFLVAAELISREIRPVYIGDVQTNNVPVLTPNPDAIAALTYNIPAPESGDDDGGEGVTFEREAPSAEASDRLPSKNWGVTPEREAQSVSTCDIRENKQRSAKTINNNSANAENVVVVDFELLSQMQAVGVSEQVAKRLIAQKPDVCRQQLEWLPLREAKKPCGALVAAIRQEWAPPEQVQEIARQKEAAQKREVTRHAEDNRKAQEEAERRAAEIRLAEENRQLDAYFAELPANEKGAIEAETKRRLGILGNRASEGAFQAMRRNLLRPELGLASL